MKRLAYFIFSAQYTISMAQDTSQEPLVHIYPERSQLPSEDNFKKLKAQNLTNTQKKTPEHLFSVIPGAQFTQIAPDAPQSYLKLRGAEPEHILVQILGVDIRDPSAGGRYDFSTLRLSDIETLEIRNFSSEGTISGVVDIDPRAGSGTPRFQAEGEVGSFETKSLALESQGEHNQSHYYVSGSLSTAGDGSLKNKDLGNTTADRTGKQNFTARAGHFITPLWESEIYISQLKNKYKINSIAGPLPINSANHGVEQQGIIIAKNSVDTFHKQWRHTLLLSQVSHRRDTVVQNQSSTYTGQTLGSKYISDLNLKTHRFKTTFGFKQDRATANSPRANTQKFLQGGLTYQQELMKNLTLEGGGELEKATYVSPQKSYFGHLRAQVHPKIALWTRAGTGYQIPSLAQLVPDPTYTLPNPTLKPMTSLQFEVGAEFKPQDIFQMTLTYYKLKLKDFIIPQFLSIGKYQYRNEDQRYNQGIESAFRYQPFTGLDSPVLKELLLRGGYTLLESTNSKTQQRPIRSARHTLNGGIEGPLFAKTRFFLEGSYQSAMRDTDFYTGQRVKLPPQRMIRAGAQYQIQDNLEVKGRVENILNQSQEKIYGYPSRGFGVYLSLVLKGDILSRKDPKR